MERQSEKALAAFVGIGVLCGTALGALITLIVKGRRERAPLASPTPPWAQLGAPAAPQDVQQVVQTTTPQINSELRSSVTQTLTLSTTRPVRVLNGGSKRHWRASLRNIGPDGSIAFVSTDPTVVSFPSMSAAIPAGEVTEVHVRPGDGLFALGSVSNVRLSIVASEEPI